MALAVTIEDVCERTLAGCAHSGDYKRINTAFERLAARLAPAGPITPAGPFIGVYYDDPGAVPEADLRAFAGVVVDPTAPVDTPLERLVLPAGRHATTIHTGPYAELDRVYAALYREWLPANGHEPADHPAFEIYLNDPRQTPPTEVETAIYIPIV